MNGSKEILGARVGGFAGGMNGFGMSSGVKVGKPMGTDSHLDSLRPFERVDMFKAP